MLGFRMRSRSFWLQRPAELSSCEPLVFLPEPVAQEKAGRHSCSVKVNQKSRWPFYCWGSSEAASKAWDRKNEAQLFQLTHAIYAGEIFCHDSQRPSASAWSVWPEGPYSSLCFLRYECRTLPSYSNTSRAFYLMTSFLRLNKIIYLF